MITIEGLEQDRIKLKNKTFLVIGITAGIIHSGITAVIIPSGELPGIIPSGITATTLSLHQISLHQLNMTSIVIITSGMAVSILYLQEQI